MGLFQHIKSKISTVKNNLKENSVDSSLWLINIVPSFVGFSFSKERISVLSPFWIIHLSMLFYVYGVGNLVYQLNYADSASEYIKSNVNISLLFLIGANSWFFLKQWSLLRSVLKDVKQNDEWAKASPEFQKKHQVYMRTVKYIVLIFYATNYSQLFFIYLPHRGDINNDFSMTPCVGMEPLHATPNKQICVAILCLQELSIVAVVLNYQALLLLFIDHTAAMYKLLAEEIMSFNQANLENSYVKERLPILLKRHVMILGTIDKVKRLYSVPMGVNFASNAVCINLFFYLPLDQWLPFIPILIYCFLTFFLYCYLCQRLINAAELFERAVYSCGWEKYDVKIQQTIYLMLLNAQGNVEILAADIIPVNIYTFATTLQFMFKFVTVIKF